MQSNASFIDILIDEITGSTHFEWQVIAVRLLGAALLCGLIGYERETKDRPAGLRTHILVGLAAAVYCIITLELTHYSYGSDSARTDPVRIVEAVTGGVAFLAAGMIVFSKGEVKGLTTGATLWLSAAIGLGIGLGLWRLAAMTTLLALIVIRFVKRVEDRYIRDEDEAPPGPEAG